eukprot:268295_1
MTYSKNVANLRKTSSLSSNANMERDKLLNDVHIECDYSTNIANHLRYFGKDGHDTNIMEQSRTASNTNSKRGTKRQRGSDVIVTEPPRKKAKKAHNKKKQQNKKKNKPKPSSTLQISDGFSFL